MKLTLSYGLYAYRRQFTHVKSCGMPMTTDVRLSFALLTNKSSGPSTPTKGYHDATRYNFVALPMATNSRMQNAALSHVSD
jgi:hypothetical protein